jgi:hypothetical protein
MMRGEYSTRQKRELQKFLMERSMQHFSVVPIMVTMPTSRRRGLYS